MRTVMKAETARRAPVHEHRRTPARTVPTWHGLLDTGAIQRQIGCPCGGGCPVCSGVVQAKLEVGPANDQYEQEADLIADKVMRMPEPGIQRTPT